ncbi:MAG: NfeD family protein [Cyanobacteriota bacterium]
MVPLIWLLLGLSLLGLLAIGLDFDGLMAAAVAALAMSWLLSLLPLPLSGQIVVFTACTVVLLLALLQWSQRRRQRAIPPAEAADQAVVISGFEEQAGGRVRWQGQSWAATNLELERTLRPGDTVVVMGREGTRLQVLPGPDTDSPAGS